MVGKRLSVMTFNLWAEDHWHRRRKAVEQLFLEHPPDILCVQEFSEKAEDLLDGALPNHDHVDPSMDWSGGRRFPGWGSEGNIYWNGNILELVPESDNQPNIGRDKVAIHEQPDQEHRRLFWVRLQFKDTNRTVFVSTAQLTFKGSKADEAGLNPRKEETSRIIRALNRTIRRDRRGHSAEPAFFMGDVNDTSPIFDLYYAGFVDCFTGMNRPIPPTVPVYPKGADIDVMPLPKPLRSLSSDCITANRFAKPKDAKVLEFRDEKGIAPSDHWPVWAKYKLSWP